MTDEAHKLPSPLGPVEQTTDHIRVWNADATKFDPISYVESPNAPQEPTSVPYEPRPVAAPRQLPEAQSLPISFIPSDKVLPRRYLVHLHSQRCINCGTVHEWSQVYAHNNMKSRTGSGAMVVNLVPVDHFKFKLPVSVVRAKQITVPACHECADRVTMDHLVDPTNTIEWQRIYAVGYAAGGGAIDPAVKPFVPKADQKKPAKAPKTIDDFLKF